MDKTPEFNGTDWVISVPKRWSDYLPGWVLGVVGTIVGVAAFITLLLYFAHN